MYIYTSIHREREREGGRGGGRDVANVCVFLGAKATLCSGRKPIERARERKKRLKRIITLLQVIYRESERERARGRESEKKDVPTHPNRILFSFAGAKATLSGRKSSAELATPPPNLGEEIIDDPNAAVTIKPVNIFIHLYMSIHLSIHLSIDVYLSIYVYLCTIYIYIRQRWGRE